MASPSNVLRYLNHFVVTKPLWKQDLGFLSHVSVSANHILVHEVTGADAFFGSHADGHVQKALAGCFPILANILGQQSCLSSLSYSTCKPEILCTMLMRMGEDFSCPWSRLNIIVFLCPCKIYAANEVERKRPLQNIVAWFYCFLYTHPSVKWLLPKWKLMVKEESKKSSKVI